MVNWPAGRLVSCAVLAESVHPFELCSDPARRKASDWVQVSCPWGGCDRHSAACPTLVMAHSERNPRGFSASCPSRAEPSNVLFAEIPADEGIRPGQPKWRGGGQHLSGDAGLKVAPEQPLSLRRQRTTALVGLPHGPSPCRRAPHEPDDVRGCCAQRSNASGSAPSRLS